MNNETKHEMEALMQRFRQIEEDVLAASKKHAMLGNYDFAERYLSLAKRTHSLSDDLQSLGEPEMIQRTSSNPPVPKDRSFPRFWVEGDTLRKMGSTRDGTGTYVHGIPKGEFAKVGVALKKLASHQGSFSVRDFVKSCGMPDYHPYIVLAALEDLRLLRSLRRGLVSFVNAAEFSRAADQAWDQLAKRPNPEELPQSVRPKTQKVEV